MNVSFIHLHVHTEFSIKNGLIKINDLIACAKQLKMPAIAITDYMNMFSVIKFYQKAIKNGIKPIIGCEIEFCEDDNLDKRFSLVLLCQNSDGYKNLSKLLSNAYLQNKGIQKPFILKSDLKKYSSGLIALSGIGKGDVGASVLQRKKGKAIALISEWKQCFGDRFYLEAQRVNKSYESVTGDFIKLAFETDTPVVATNDALFVKQSDYDAHLARVCIHDGELLAACSSKQEYSNQQYLKSQEEMSELFSDLPETLENSVNIAKRCSLILDLGKVILPDFPIPKEYTADSFLALKAHKGLEKELDNMFRKDNSNENCDSIRKHYLKRLELELKTISAMGYSSYFLIVYDFIRWAKDNNIPVGPGRGSGAGSLVAYVLNITGINPIKYGLLFERFLNPERVSMPDFDIDFCMDGRDRVIEYVYNRYGKNNVSQIITFGTMAAKAVVRDVGRVLGYPYPMVDTIAKLIPFGVGVTLKDALKEEKFAERYQSEEEVRAIIDLAIELEGITRNVGRHAGGVVIAPKEITSYMPVYCEPDGNALTQYDKNDVEKVGLVKFDFLGLKTLTIIKNALRIINEKLDPHEQVDINKISTNDKKTFELIRKCKTAAVFQLESRGMREIVRRLKPDCFEDIIALVALFRPGPLQSGMVDDFINRKNGLSTVSYVHPDLESILAETYGVIVYQEQVMQIGQIIGDYSLGKADLLRRAMGKKDVKEMAKHRAIFIKGALKRKVKEEVAQYLFDLMEKFAGYGFNKSHSAAYAMIAYQTAWLKAHYPSMFMAAVLSSEKENTDKIYFQLNECKSLNITIHHPDINLSQYDFTVTKDKSIRFGLGAIKGVGQSTIDMIMSTREKVGNFKSFVNFCNSIDAKKINKRNLEMLIHAGAFDSIEQSRSQLIASLATCLAYSEKKQNEKELGQNDLFQTLSDNDDFVLNKNFTEFSLLELLKAEKAALGFYLTRHPIDYFKNDLKNMNVVSLANLNKTHRLSEIYVTGFIVDIRKISTRRNDNLYFVTLDDNTSIYDIMVFDDLFSQNELLFCKNQVIVAKCLLSHDKKNNLRVRAVDISAIEDIRRDFCKEIEIVANKENFSTEKLSKLKELLVTQGEGISSVSLSYDNFDNMSVKGKLLLNSQQKIKPTDNFVINLYQLFDNQNVNMYYDNSKLSINKMMELIK